MAQQTSAAVRNTISNVEGERKDVSHLFNEMTPFYTSTASIKGLRALNVIGIFEFSVRLQAL